MWWNKNPEPPEIVWLETDNIVESILNRYRQRDNNTRPSFNQFTREQLTEGLNTDQQFGDPQIIEALAKMEAFEMIEKDVSGYYHLKKLGYEVIQADGWRAYLINEEVRRLKDLHTFNLLKKQNSWFMTASIITLISATVSLSGVVYQRLTLSTLKQEIKSQQQQIDHLWHLVSPHTNKIDTTNATEKAMR